MERDISDQSVVFYLKFIISICIIKGEEQNFKEMIESEYKMMFWLMTEENEMNFQSLQPELFNQNLRKASQRQMMEFSAELEEKSKEMIQVTCWKWHPYNICEIKERRDECVSSRIRHPVTVTYVLKEFASSSSNSTSENLLQIYLHAYKKHVDKRML